MLNFHKILTSPKIREVIEENIPVQTSITEFESDGNDHFHVSLFIRDGDPMVNDESIFTLFINPALLSIGRFLCQEFRGSPIQFCALQPPTAGLGAVSYRVDGRVPLRLTVCYEVAHWTGEYLHNEDGTPKIVIEEGEEVHAKEYVNGHILTVDVLARAVPIGV